MDWAFVLGSCAGTGVPVDWWRAVAAAVLIAGTNLGRSAAVGRRRVAAVDVSTPLLVSLEHCGVS